MKTAIIGLMQSGKSTLMSAVSRKAPPAPGKVSINEMVVPVPDERLDWLKQRYEPKKTTHANIDCLDVPGFDFTSEHGRSASRRLLGELKTVELLVCVLRSFQDSSVAAYRNRVDPLQDMRELKTELLLSDLELVSNRIERIEKELKRPSKDRA